MTIIKNHIGRILFFAAICSGILIGFVSCRDDGLSEYAANGRIAFAVSDGNTPVSRAAAGNETDASAVSVHETIPLLVNGNTVNLTFVVESNREITTSARCSVR